MPPRRRTGGRRKKTGGASTVRVVKGKINLKVSGFPGTQKLAPSLLIRKIAKKHIRRAAAALLRGTKKGPGRRVRGRKRANKRRTGRKQKVKRRRRRAI